MAVEYVKNDTPLLKVTCEEDGVAINLSSSALTVSFTHLTLPTLYSV